MSAIGGSVQEVTIAGRSFAVAADAEGQIKIGGFENDVQADGGGTARMIKTRVPWNIDGLTLSIDDDNGDREFLQSTADGNSFVPIAITLAGGAVYQGSGQITAEFPTSTTNATAAVSLMGPGGLTKQ